LIEPKLLYWRRNNDDRLSRFDTV